MMGTFRLTAHSRHIERLPVAIIKLTSRLLTGFIEWLRENTMIRQISTALMAASLLTGAARAENAKDTTGAVTHKAGEWRASKLVGVDVYNEANEKIGDISDVILESSGKAAKVIIGVGGFLGMGEHYVAVTYDRLKWVDEPVRAKTANDTTADRKSDTNRDGDRTTGAAGTTRDANNWYPDHVVYNATKDQLKAMPQFKY